MIANKRLDAPVDYRELWHQLRLRIEELSAKAATDAMNAEKELEIRQKQGAYRFGYTLISEMDRLLDDARASYGPLRSLRNSGDA